MKKIIKFNPQCDTCGGALAIVKGEMDLISCSYILYTECIVCANEQIEILSLEDFIDLNLYCLGKG